MPTDPIVPTSIDPEKPSAARMYDYFLGGHHNFAADRIMAEKVAATYPDIPLATRANRAFLRRMVNFLIVQGIDQFLDIGSGVPTAGNVHEVAQAANPEARVVYVDTDPVAVAHSEVILQGNPHTAVIQADACEILQIIHHQDVRRVLDFNRPIAVLIIAVLHFVPDNAVAHTIVRQLRDHIAPGSYIAISHGTNEGVPLEIYQQLMKLYAGTNNPTCVRNRAQIMALFEGLELVEPGIVFIPQWHPESAGDLFLDQPERSMVFGGLGRKP
jgi:hypothetical protein